MADRDQYEQRVRMLERDMCLPNPVSLFDYHLKALDASYIQFFQDRIRIEEQYIASLTQLHQKTRYIDSQIDQGADVTTLRQAWREARDCLDREAEARGAFVSALRTDVLSPLITLKESNDRTRKRIKEEIKDSHQAHIEYQENVLPRLKQRYIRKVQEVEEYRNERAFIPNSGFAPIPHNLPHPGEKTSPTSTTFGSSLPPHGVPAEAVPGSPPRHPIHAPQPQALPANPLGQVQSRPSTQSHAPRNRSPSAPTSLSDIGKALKGLLPDSGNRPVLNAMREFGERANPAMKNVKAKREADEADKEYRKGVHWLETLRIKRASTIRSGYTSLEDFIWEQGLTVRKVLQRYVDSLIGTSHTNSQLAGHIGSSVAKVSLERDRDILTQSFAQVDVALRRALPPTLYFNYLVGESKDLIFGVGLVDYATARGLTGGPGVALGLAGGGKAHAKEGSTGKPVRGEDRIRQDSIGSAHETVPRLVQLCVRDIDRRGLNTEGIYRISGRYANVQELRHLVEKDEAAFEINPQSDDVFCVSSLLKQYLRELPEPVFRMPLQERQQHTEDREDHIASNFRHLRGKMRKLPPVHQATLRLVIEHLARVASHSSTNKMDAKNLSIVFGALLFGEDEMPKDATALTMTQTKDSVLEDLITYAPLLFDDDRANSPPLPPAPQETPATVDNGSAQIRLLANDVRTTTNHPDRSQDFTPSLPPQPGHSIHPAARRQGTSSSTSSTSQVELSHSTQDLMARIDLGSPKRETTLPPAPPPSSEKPPRPSSVKPSIDRGSQDERASLHSPTLSRGHLETDSEILVSQSEANGSDRGHGV
ncbi:hypothetical protein FRB99_006074 [Tulasnella sp. 403]|nr:hypothetical protein FRB99_006074 [Tulasnella sp. 403]